MKNKDLRGLDQDLNKGIEYNRKHGGSPLKKIMRRPEEFGGASHFGGSMGGNDEFWEKVKYWKENQCCYICLKKNGRKINDMYCSKKCKELADYKHKSIRNV